MEQQLRPLGREFHDKKMQAYSVGRTANPTKPKPEVHQGYQVYGPNPVEFERKRQPGYVPPRDDYRYKGPTRIGGVPLSTNNMRTQIETLSKVGPDESAKRTAAQRKPRLG